MRPWRLDGFMTFNPTGMSRLGIVLIAVAGPIASLLGALATAHLIGDRHPGSLLNDALAVATWNGLLMGVISLVPMRMTDSLAPGMPTFATDGMVAMNAVGVGLGSRAVAGERSATRASARHRHVGRAGWWAVVVLGICLMLVLAAAPGATDRGEAFLLFLGVTVAGLWGLARS